MAEKVFTNSQQIIEVTYDGDHDVNDSNIVISQLYEHGKRLRAKKIPVRLLLNLTKLGKTDRRARQNVINVARSWDYYKIAVYGANVFNKVLAELIIYGAGRQSKIKIFSGRDEAVKWLKT